MLACRNLFRNLRRTLAIILTVALGAGALFSFDGFINGILNEYRESTIHAHYGYGQINTKGYRDKVFEDPSKHWIPNWGALEPFLQNLEGVEKIFPRNSFSALLKNDKITVSGHGQGIDAKNEADFFNTLNIEQGVTLENQPNGILLGIGLAKALNVGPGDTVTVMATTTKSVINKQKFVVSGIFHTGSNDFDSRIFRIQLTAAQKLLKTPKIELVSLGLRNLSDWTLVAAAIETAFPELEATSFDVLDEIYYKHSVDWLNAQFKVVQVIILAIVLLGIFNTVSASILERKQEIGNLRANGESVFQVMKLIVSEGVLLAFFGSLIGIAFSYFILTTFIHKGLLMPPGPGLTRQFLVTFSFEWSMVLATLAMSTVAALIASALAGMRVARMPITNALRSY